jgi:uncharacterized cupredoxin-like copper-binding protein
MSRARLRSTRGHGIPAAAVLVSVALIAAAVIAAFQLTSRDSPGSTESKATESRARTQAEATRVLRVELGEWYVAPSVHALPAGRVTFRARNVGMVPHELMVERYPIKLDRSGTPVEAAAMGMVEDMAPMHGAGRMTLRLRPGRYELFCNLPGHYAADQHTVLRVGAR